jgi:exodeoxyribonuclease V alpha subunit
LVQIGQRLYLRRPYSAEQTILQSLQQRNAHPVQPLPELPQLLDALFPDSVHDRTADLQRRACEVAAQGAFTLITGGPGTGKTTTVTRLLALLMRVAQDGNAPLPRIKLAAPTGKAASRLTQSIKGSAQKLPGGFALDTSTLQAATLHSLLGVRGAAWDRGVQQLEADIVIVDEASMVDLDMMARLFAAVPPCTRLILLGDKDQLASVEAGAVLAQLCQRSALASRIVTLTHSHRFSADGGIDQWAARVNAGDSSAVLQLCNNLPPWSTAFTATVQRLKVQRSIDTAFVDCVAQGWSAWLSGVQDVAQRKDCSDSQAKQLLDSQAAFQVLCALRSGPWGVETLNAQLQRALGFGSAVWFSGRPVMVTRNDYGLRLMNGDVGLCLWRKGMLRVAFGDSESGLRWIAPARLEAVESVFAMTVHKSQGSEFGRVLLVLPDQASPILTRELLYTGITRASHGMVLLAPAARVLSEAVARRVQRAGGLQDG